MGIGKRNFWRVLDITRLLCTVSQYEDKYVGGYGPYLQTCVYDKLREDTLKIVDFQNVTKSLPMPTMSVKVDELPPVVQITRSRAILEIERRFFGNTTDVPFEDPPQVNINMRQLICMFLDIRLVTTIPQMNNTVYEPNDDEDNDGELTSCTLSKRAINLTKTCYIDFYVKTKQFDEMEMKGISLQINSIDLSDSSPTRKKGRRDEIYDEHVQVSGITAGTNKNVLADFGLVQTASTFEDEDESEDEKIERWENEATVEFSRVSKMWLKFAQTIEWKHEFPELEKKIDGSAVDVIADLMRLDMGVLYKKT